MISSLIPNSWVSANLGEICTKVTDGSHNPPKAVDSGLPMLSAKNIQLRKIEFSEGYRSIPEEQFEVEDRRTQIAPGDVLLTIVGALGRTALVLSTAPKFTLQRSVAVLASPYMIPAYLCFALEEPAFQKQIIDNAKGTAQKGIYLKKLKELELKLPPLAEQKQIAAKLDELLAQVDTLKTRLDAIPAILKRFRQSVLAAAVSGRLTEEWRGSDGIDSWKEVSVGDLVDIVNGKAFPSKEYQSSGVKLLRPGNLHVSGKVVWNDKNTTYLSSAWLDKRPELILQKGALLMNLTAQSLKDEFLGRVCVLDESCDVLLNQRICSFESKAKYDVKPYLYVYFKSPAFREYVATLDSGSLIKHLNIKDVKSHSILLPGEYEQTEIVRRVEQLFAFADQIEQRVRDAQARVNQLTQSILAKAFRGELTAEWRAQHPELITGEHSAQALLERIKAEQKTIKPVKKKQVARKGKAALS